MTGTLCCSIHVHTHVRLMCRNWKCRKHSSEECLSASTMPALRSGTAGDVADVFMSTQLICPSCRDASVKSEQPQQQ